MILVEGSKGKVRNLSSMAFRKTGNILQCNRVWTKAARSNPTCTIDIVYNRPNDKSGYVSLLLRNPQQLKWLDTKHRALLEHK